jgi:hypothetical protein
MDKMLSLVLRLFRLAGSLGVSAWQHSFRGNMKKNELSEVELGDGGCIEPPEANGDIRRRDKDGNMMDVRSIGDEGWDEWADLFDATASDFAPNETLIIDALAQLVQRYGPEHGLTKCSYDGDNNSASMVFTYSGESWIISSNDVEPCS